MRTFFSLTLFCVSALLAMAQVSASDYIVRTTSSTTGGGGGYTTLTAIGAVMPVSTAQQTALDTKQAVLVSASNIKTVNGSTLLGSGDLVISSAAAWGSITGTLSSQTDLQTALNAKGTSNFSGAYIDLTGKPTLFDGAYASLTGKPTLFDGVYASLTSKPTLGTAAATAATDYATAGQGTLAGTALQPAGNGSALTGLTKTQVGLSAVENTAISTWVGSASITTLGTIASGTVPVARISGLGTLATQSGTFSGTSSGTNTGDQDLSALAPKASPTFTGTVTLPASTALVTPALGTPTSGNLANCTFPTLNQNTSGSAATLTTPRNINGVAFNGSANITVTAAGSTLSDPVTFANGADVGAAATSATTGTITVSMTTSIVTITPTNACTFNASGGVTGQLCTFVVTTSGTSSFVLTWGTNFKTTATLATGTTTARTFCVTFRCTNGTQWVEISRTAAMA